jgi:AAA domain
LFRAGRRWSIRHEELEKQRAASKRELDQTNLWVSQHKSELANTIIVRQRHEYARNDAENDLAIARQCIDAARERWPGAAPFSPDFACDEHFQMCAPWADQEFTAARNRLFLEALRLHKTFILRAAPRLRDNLNVARTVLRGNLAANRSLKPNALLAVWQSLFLVVPMISTTFASLPRLFDGLGREAFGWLFIDEAGQATPQQAVGGIWRSRRTVIVGDPQQLEPIVTLPSSAQHALRRHYDVDEQWTPDITSAQRVADRLARFGTLLPDQGGDSKVWVGAPLRVHRRCDRPILDVSNTIAYGGELMVYGTKHEGDFPGQNCWIDVRSGQSQGNWVPAEGTALAQLLREFAEQHVAPQNIRVISPFRDVVRNAKEIGRRQFDDAFADNNVGTIHTVQGKEADVVVLVLGSKPNNNRARAWAAEKPNLLNVAVSRARRRLYVIGNRQNWQDHRFFNVLAATLPSPPLHQASGRSACRRRS